jgi:hypothetical protein
MRHLTLQLCDLLQFLRDNADVLTRPAGLYLYTGRLHYQADKLRAEHGTMNTCSLYMRIYICIYIYIQTHTYKGIVSNKNRNTNLT